MARRRTKAKPKPTPNLSQFMRGELIGSVLVLLAILTLLSLLSPTKGQVTAGLIGGLRSLFGVGVWLLPVLLGGLGVWLALRDVVEGNTHSPWRLVGAFGLFLVFVGLAHILGGAPASAEAAAAGTAGGLVGWLIGQGLITALGTPAAVAALIVLATVSIFALSGMTLSQLSNKLADAWRSVRGASAGPEGVRVNPPLPLGREPFWRRWWRALARAARDLADQPAADLVALVRRLARAAGDRVLRTPRRPGQRLHPSLQPDPSRASSAAGQAWRLPMLSDILEDSTEQDIQQEDLRKRVQTIENTLVGFGVPVQVVEVNQGPAVTQFGLRPGAIVRRDRKGEEKRIKVRVSQIQALANDLSLALAASPIRIEAPVPGRDFVGVEVPNVQISLVSLRGVMESEEWAATKGALVFGLGRDVSGQAAVADLARMPHLLIAGATGSGKSVCVNAIITTLLLTHTPDTLRFLMIDPKRVELTVYNGIPHLIAPVVVDVERAVPVLQWATREMERRYKLFSKVGARNIEAYNEKLAGRGEPVLPYIVIVIDELADLMLSAPEDVERYICRIAQMARATGIHLVLATQRPSVDVVTGLIKANFPARIAFAVTSQVDSRVILDTPGAEQLLGRGDMLFMAPDASKLQRLQGCFVADRETHRLVRYWKGARTLGRAGRHGDAGRRGDRDAATAAGMPSGSAPAGPAMTGSSRPGCPARRRCSSRSGTRWRPPKRPRATGTTCIARRWTRCARSGRASVSLLQRRLRIGYSPCGAADRADGSRRHRRAGHGRQPRPRGAAGEESGNETAERRSRSSRRHPGPVSISGLYLVLGVALRRLHARLAGPRRAGALQLRALPGDDGQLPGAAHGRLPPRLPGRDQERAGSRPSMSIDPIRYEFHQPPLYYALAAPIYALTGGDLLPLRLFSVALGAGIVLLAYAVARRVFPRRPALALAAAAFVAFLPQHLATVSQVGNDVLAELLFAAVLYRVGWLAWQNRRTVHSGMSAFSLRHWDSCSGLILITKTTAYIAVPLAAGVLLWRWWRERAALRRILLEGLAVILPAAADRPAVVCAQCRRLRLAGRPGPDAARCHRRRPDAHGRVPGAARLGRLLRRAGRIDLQELLGRLRLDGRLAGQPRSTSRCSCWAGSRGWVGAAHCVPREGWERLAALTYHAPRIARYLLASSALLTLLVYAWYNLTFLQHQGRYLFTALIPVAIFFSLGWEAAIRPRASRILAAALVVFGFGLVAWGALSGHGLPRWPLAITLVFAAGLAILDPLARLLEKAFSIQRSAFSLLVFALPFAALPLLDLYALFGAIVPQLTPR